MQLRIPYQESRELWLCQSGRIPASAYSAIENLVVCPSLLAGPYEWKIPFSGLGLFIIGVKILHGRLNHLWDLAQAGIKGKRTDKEQKTGNRHPDARSMARLRQGSGKAQARFRQGSGKAQARLRQGSGQARTTGEPMSCNLLLLFPS